MNDGMFAVAIKKDGCERKEKKQTKKSK